MKQTNASIWQASLMSGLSQLQLWILIQNKIIKPTPTHEGVKINTQKLRQWIILNSRTIYQLQLSVDQRDIKFSLKKCIRKWKENNRR